MELQTFISWLGYSAIVLIIAGPVLVRLVRNIAVGLKLRRRRKATPGPLLGVVYPQTTKKDKK
jgi:hypothetical protein